MTESNAGPVGGKYRLNSLKVSLPMGEIWEAERDGDPFMVLVSAAGFDAPDEIAKSAVSYTEDLEIPGVIPWSDGGEEDGRFWLAAPLV
ncbi:MAG: hypothetical protein VX938_00930, partial [Myxococcota bacterium]|nr:hypothetical protein [Myxococcota bacterium]